MRRLIVAVSLLAAVSCAGPRAPRPAGDREKIVTHEVRAGEGWREIAEAFYGDPERAAALAGFNGGVPDVDPDAGSGVRIPLTKNDLRRLDRRLDAAAVYNEGLSLADRGDYPAAVELFRKALSKDPGFEDASFNLAVTWRRLGRYDEATDVLRDLVERRPDESRYRFALGNVRFHAGDYGGAREAFLAVLDIDAAHGEAVYALAVSCARLGRDREAAERYGEYVALRPEGAWSAEARKALARLRAGEGR